VPKRDNIEHKKVTVATIKEAFKLFVKFNSYVVKYWKAELLLILCGIISTLLSLFTPYLGKLILDNGILQRDLHVFLRYTIIGGVVYILRQGVERGVMPLRSYTSRKIKISLARAVFKKTQKISIRSFQESSTGEFVARLNMDIAASSNIIANTVPEIVIAMARIICITLVIIMIEPRLMIVVLLYQAIVIFVMRFIMRKEDALSKEAYKKTWQIQKILTYIFSQIYIIKASGNMMLIMRKYFRAFLDSIRLDALMSRLQFASGVLYEISNKLFFGVVGFAGTIMVIKGDITLGSLGAVMAYISQGTSAYAALSSIFERIVINRHPLGRLADFFDTKIYVYEKKDALDKDLPDGKIEFRNVTFGYDDKRRILEDISFIIKPQAKIALVGRSGSGKTTIINLILRLYDADSGQVLLDDTGVRDLCFKAIYRQIGLAPQTPYTWNGTLKEAISYGSPSVDADECVKAARLAEVHSFAEKLPYGYDTTFSDMVSKISQGERQRVAIAAALVKKPRILILDEACSSLDSLTEEKIIHNIIEDDPQRTLIIVSHRLSTVRKMERVFFFKSPGVMASAEHAALAELDPDYSRLFAGQIPQEEYSRMP